MTGVGCGSSSGSGGTGGSSGSGGTGALAAQSGAVPMMTAVVPADGGGRDLVYNVTDTGFAYTKNSASQAFEDIGGMAGGTMG